MGKAGLVNNLLTEGSESDAVCLLRLQHKWIWVLSDSAQNPLLSCEEILIHRDGTSGSSKAELSQHQQPSMRVWNTSLRHYFRANMQQLLS